jgi:hypothetical protein
VILILGSELSEFVLIARAGIAAQKISCSMILASFMIPPQGHKSAVQDSFFAEEMPVSNLSTQAITDPFNELLLASKRRPERIRT